MTPTSASSRAPQQPEPQPQREATPQPEPKSESKPEPSRTAKPQTTPGAPSPFHIVFIAAEDEYLSETTLALLKTTADEWGWQSTLLTSSPSQSAAENIPGLEALDNADLIVLYMRFRTIPLEQVEHLDRYLKRGKPVVGIRTSTHAFAYPKDHPLVAWNDFGKNVLGAPWIRHFGHDSSTDVTIAPGAEKDELLKGVAPAFHVRSWLYDLEGKYPPSGSRILLVGQSCDASGKQVRSRRTSAVAWTRETEWGGKVFMTTMGHPDDFKEASFLALLHNGMRWASGREEEK
jgi:type 1 glutamine amidotransferase